MRHSHILGTSDVLRLWGLGRPDAQVSGRTVEITHLLLLPPEKKKAATLEFGFSGFSMFFGLRRKFLRRMTRSAAMVVQTAGAPPAEQLERADWVVSAMEAMTREEEEEDYGISVAAVEGDGGGGGHRWSKGGGRDGDARAESEAEGSG